MTGPSLTPELPPSGPLYGAQNASDADCGAQDVRVAESASQGLHSASARPEAPQEPADGPHTAPEPPAARRDTQTPDKGADGRETGLDRFEVWPLDRVLREVAVGSGDWTWAEEFADLDERHAATGYLAMLEEKIRANGITMPVMIGSDGRLWDGHHRLRIAVRLGIGYVPVEIITPGSAPPLAVERVMRELVAHIDSMRAGHLLGCGPRLYDLADEARTYLTPPADPNGPADA